jgi:hypothetical protein
MCMMILPELSSLPDLPASDIFLCPLMMKRSSVFFVVDGKWDFAKIYAIGGLSGSNPSQMMATDNF